MNVRITQIDGKLPNLALMRISAWHRSQGHSIHFTRDVEQGLFETAYDAVYAYDITETWERIWHRFNKMVERGISPYPMVFDRTRTDLLSFQRWVITGIYRFVKWDEYKRSTKSKESVEAFNLLRPISDIIT